ncbi:aspartate/glutamate racemase family protein [Nocardia sp. NPDC051570]|uniref:aspartate/glutamate racemase family protein n=1 Tax=Nocardia sp. NPDC051570 TaxID=3364324 RepID=UPI0037A67C78
MTRRIGIVGGVGPLAAAHFYQRLLQVSGSYFDEDYPAAILVGEQVPSRIGHLLWGGPSPLPILLDAIRRLERAGADLIVIPSATTHAYYDTLTAAASVPICNLLAETSDTCDRHNYRRVLFLATAATARLRLFEPHLSWKAQALYPDPPVQRAVNDLIERVKRGASVEALRPELDQWINRASRPGIDCVVLGCTELSLIAPESEEQPVVDITDVLAHAALRCIGTSSDPGPQPDIQTVEEHA